MNHYFDDYIQDHLQDMLCEAEKNHALAIMKKADSKPLPQVQLKLSHVMPAEEEIQLQDCAISASFSSGQL